jgi:integral membrane protein
VMLLILVGVAMPLRYLGENPAVSHVVSPVHGFLYIVYLLAALDLAVKARWRPKTTLLVLISGAVPFLSFVMERRVTQRVQAQLDAEHKPATVA